MCVGGPVVRAWVGLPHPALDVKYVRCGVLVFGLFGLGVFRRGMLMLASSRMALRAAIMAVVRCVGLSVPVRFVVCVSACRCTCTLVGMAAMQAFVYTVVIPGCS